MKLRQYSQRGDTIIEVLFAMAIIGLVLASAYSIASKNLQTSQFSKERTQATKIAESQVEQIKALETPPNEATDFCVNVTDTTPVNYLPDPTCTEGFFDKIVNRVGETYTVIIEWIPPGGSDTNKANVTVYYRYGT